MKGAESRLRSFPPPWSKKQRQCGRDFRGNVHKQSPTFQAGALIELSGDVDTAFEIYSKHTTSMSCWHPLLSLRGIHEPSEPHAQGRTHLYPFISLPSQPPQLFIRDL